MCEILEKHAAYNVNSNATAEFSFLGFCFFVFLHFLPTDTVYAPDAGNFNRKEAKQQSE